MRCPNEECGEEIPAGAIDCPNCGYEIQAEDTLPAEPDWDGYPDRP